MKKLKFIFCQYNQKLFSNKKSNWYLIKKEIFILKICQQKKIEAVYLYFFSFAFSSLYCAHKKW